MTLMLHAGAEPCDYDALRALETPEATDTHVPIPHHRVVDLVKYSLGYFGHEITEENYGVTEDGARFFGLLSLRSFDGAYEDTVGLRNSHDKKFPIGISFGSRVFVCDNLAFIAEHVIKRKHTANAKRDLPGLVGELVEPLGDQREAQHRTIDRYRGTELTPLLADHAMMEMYRQGIINVTRIADVHREWEEPSFEEFQADHSAWRLFNAATYVLTGKVTEQSQLTPRLHKVIDAVCERLH
ncbi:DUF932 domain-containing protein [Oricola indica]|uniref:DUF932 domain-containing protein n=1 Tax=Oricola indica TaxID=2872591 RepID=UPI003CCC39C2